MNADGIKLEILKWIESIAGGVVSFEFPFLSDSRRCDVMVVSNDTITAIEIKSDFDNLSKLSEQLYDYKKCFNSVYVACGDKYISSLRKLEKSIGIILVTENGVKLIRKAKVKKSIDLYNLLDMCTYSELASTYQGRSKVEIIKNIIKNNKIADARRLAVKIIERRVKSVFDVYIKEKATTPTLDDVFLLSMRKISF